MVSVRNEKGYGEGLRRGTLPVHGITSVRRTNEGNQHSFRRGRTETKKQRIWADFWISAGAFEEVYGFNGRGETLLR